MTMFSKRITTLALAAILALGAAGAAEAANGRDYRPDAYAYPGLSPEQEAAARKLHAESLAGTTDLRDALRAKRAELDAQLASPDPDKGKIESLSRDIGELRGKLMAARVDLRARLAREGIPAEAYGPAPQGRPGPGGPGPNAPGYGPCWGPDGHGYGYGYHHGRRGGHHGGYGPRGGCWN